MKIVFNKPFLAGNELNYIADAHKKGILAGDGPYTKLCHKWLEEKFNVHKALLTHSCTGALEMAAILSNIRPGDEIIMPSYTFVSTSNAFVLRGGVPVFVDVRKDTCNIDEALIRDAITEKTKAIAVVHYAGVSCDMHSIMKIANEHNLIVIEDAAQGIMSSFDGQPLGSIAHIGCVSFHETKNIISGEGGALLINDRNLINRAEIIREKGTNRTQFMKGEVDKYTWQDIGSSYLPGEIIAAFLWAQIEKADWITKQRIDIWNKYYTSLEKFESRGLIKRPTIPENCEHNAHMFYILCHSSEFRGKLIKDLKDKGIQAVPHYIPLHSSPHGIASSRSNGSLVITDDIAYRILRLPLWINMPINDVLKEVHSVLDKY